MKINVKKQLNKSTNLNINSVRTVLENSGFSVKDGEDLTFKEYHNFTIHSGKNKQMIFKPLLQGQVIIDQEESELQFKVDINGIIFKATLVFAMVSFVAFLLVENSVQISIFIGLIIGGTIYKVNKAILENRIDNLTNEIDK